MSPRSDDQPVPLREALSEIASELRIGDAQTQRMIDAELPAILGGELAPHVCAGLLRDGVLTLEVDDRVWTTPLRYLESRIVDGLGGRLPRGAIHTVRVAVRRGRERPGNAPPSDIM